MHPKNGKRCPLDEWSPMATPSDISVGESPRHGMALVQEFQRAVAHETASFEHSVTQLICYQALAICKDIHALKAEILKAVNSLGFSDFTFTRLVFKDSLENHLITTPQAMLDDYHADAFYQHDMALAHAEQCTDPIYQTSIEDFVSNAPCFNEMVLSNRALLRMSARHGYYDYYHIPTRGSDGENNVLLTVTTKGQSPSGLHRTVERSKPTLHMLAKAIEFIGSAKFPEQFLGGRAVDLVSITPKPLQLLSLMAQEDLSVKDAAQAMGISLNTANKHMASAKRALNTQTAAGAVYSLAQSGLISREYKSHR